jgi:large subunit ribosomal protein L31
MKEGIHPKYYPEAKVACSCGNTWTTGSTREMLRTDVCNQCHPFYPGEQRIIDTAGQVDRFMKRLTSFSSHQEDAKSRQAALLKKTEQKFLKQQVVALDLSDELFQVLHDSNIITVGDLAKKVASDKQGLLALKGVDDKVVADIETKLAAAREAYFAKI